MNAAALQELAILAAVGAGVGGEPLSQIFHQFVGGGCMALLEADVVLLQASQQALLFGAMRDQTGKSVESEQAVFAFNVQAHQFGNAGEHGADGAEFAPLQQGQTKLVEGIEQDAMLIVKGLYANRRSLIPNE